MAVNPCLIIVCAIQLSPDCPMDTVPVGGHPPPGECCPLQGPQCVCTECQHPPDCTDPDMAPVRVRNGTHHPGDCCDSYECQPIVAAANTTGRLVSTMDTFAKYSLPVVIGTVPVLSFD